MRVFLSVPTSQHTHTEGGGVMGRGRRGVRSGRRHLPLDCPQQPQRGAATSAHFSHRSRVVTKRPRKTGKTPQRKMHSPRDRTDRVGGWERSGSTKLINRTSLWSTALPHRRLPPPAVRSPSRAPDYCYFLVKTRASEDKLASYLHRDSHV